MTPVNLLIAEDQVLVRDALVTSLSRIAPVKIIGETGVQAELVEAASRLRPDIVIVASNAVEGNRMDYVRRLVMSGMKVIVLSSFTDRRRVVESLNAGAMGFVMKTSAIDELLLAIETVASGKRFLCAVASAKIVDDFGPASLVEPLTPRELDVLKLLAEGKAMKEAAAVLSISTKTVETHRRSIMDKLQLFSVAELTKHAIREGYASLD